MASLLKRTPEKLLIASSGRRFPVVVRRNSRAKRLILKIDEALGLPVLTLPARTPLTSGETFLRKHIEWLKERLEGLAPAAPFAAGSIFPFRGTPCRIVAKRGRGIVMLERREGEYVLHVPGEPEFMARRVTEWLRREARRDLERAVMRHARAIGRLPKGIRVGDPKSRWGSCSSVVVLTFSWRLVLAPPRVLDYLAAHEVAHLKEMHHGPKFWALVERLDPDYEAARLWLNKSGMTLSPVGRPS
jgi:predicted metal-dependent hydrolase